MIRLGCGASGTDLPVRSLGPARKTSVIVLGFGTGAVVAAHAQEFVRGNAAAKVRFDLVAHERGQSPPPTSTSAGNPYQCSCEIR
jgi:hypothetical protein